MMMSGRHAMLTAMTRGAAALGIVALSSTALRAETSARPPNVVVILVDDLGYADVGAQGGTDIPTPHINAIARNGVRFTDAYVTCPICAPSRAGLLTGRYPQRFGFDDNGGPHPDPAFGVPPAEVTLAEALRDAGYRTGAVGKWDVGLRDGTRPNDQGFDTFFGFLPGVNDYLRHDSPDGSISRGRPLTHGRFAPIYRNAEIVDEPAYLTDAFAREAVAFIAEADDRPFFLYLAFNAVHNPMSATPEYLERFTHLPEKRRVYAAMVSAVDDAVERVTEALRQRGVADDTLIFFLSDNGGASGASSRGAMSSPADNSPLGGRKGTFWEGGVRVPMFASWPARVPAGGVFAQPVSSMDVFATAIAAAGASRESGALDGKNLLPLMLGESQAPPHDALYWRYHGHRAMRAGDWKLIIFDDGRTQLFNLRDDIGETTNLSLAMPERVAGLRARLDAWSGELPPPGWVRRGLDDRGWPAFISLPIYEPQADPTR